MHEDGSPLSRDRRQVTITTSYEAMQGTGVRPRIAPVQLMVRDDGIVHYQFVPDKDAKLITVRVST